ncbi:hypothetical protein EYZ11_004549 [Aspergillus tanneri]|uniref:Uncharacterized protein n=1 Tax=Aspergillus tanneri TaxID=1220188 RepID=A0A4S3JKJ1_9EURO|nr:hypothetical protein EYZ11_004549 [Aspergillus tanneri]
MPLKRPPCPAPILLRQRFATPRPPCATSNATSWLIESMFTCQFDSGRNRLNLSLTEVHDYNHGNMRVTFVFGVKDTPLAKMAVPRALAGRPWIFPSSSNI